MRTVRWLAAAALLGLISISAAPAEAQSLAGKKIGLASREITNDYNRDIIAGATAVLKEAGAEVVVTDGGTDPRKHNENVESLINSGVAGIIVQLGDPKQLAPVVAKANAKGIPVITTSIGSKTEGAIADVGGDEALMIRSAELLLTNGAEPQILFTLPRGLTRSFIVHGASDLFNSPPVFAMMATRFPRVNLMMAHMGFFWAVGQAISFAGQFENLYLETSRAPIFEIQTAVREIGPHKVIWGTDSPFVDYEFEFKKMERSTSDREGYASIVGGDIARLLKL